MHTATQNTDVILAQEFQKHLSNKSRKHVIIDDVNTKRSSKQKWKIREYRLQHDKYVEHQDVKIYCATK